MPQLKAYHRPKSVSEALKLLTRSGVNTVVIAGGTDIVPHMSEMVEEVVDLQSVGLTEVNYTGKGLTLGAMVRLQTIVGDSRTPTLLQEAACREGPNTLRNAGTIGGIVVNPHKDSQLLAALLVFEAQVKVETQTDTKIIPLVDFLLDVPTSLSGGLATSISLATMGKTASAWVGRTPADTPIVAAATRLSDNNQLLLALCGVANTPVLVDPDNVKAAVNPTGDFRGSKEYRRQMAATLAKRVISEVTKS